MRKASIVASSVLVLSVAAGCSSAGPGEPIGSSSSSSKADIEAYNPLPRHFPTQDRFAKSVARTRGGNNLTNHGGPTITSAHVVAIFWGSTWTNSDPISTSLAKFIASYGETGEYNVITQYSGIQKTSLATGVVYDSSNPPTNVTDADIQAEVTKHFPKADASTIYEVFLPKGSYSSDGSATSCGGPALQYCAYHGNFTNGAGTDVKYGAMPYPSCGGCQSTGFTDTENFEHFISHETREAVTDPDGDAWYDRLGNEADDKCAWSPAPFKASGNGTNADGSAFAYQDEWSNANSGCVQTR